MIVAPRNLVVPAFLSLKVAVVTLLPCIASEKRATTLAPGAILVALLAGVVLVTLGGVLSIIRKKISLSCPSSPS